MTQFDPPPGEDPRWPPPRQQDWDTGQYPAPMGYPPQRPPQWQPRDVGPPPADKSVGAAALLTILFGPFGLFYVSFIAPILLVGGTILVLVWAAGGFTGRFSIRDPSSMLLLAGFTGLPLLAILWILSIIVGVSLASAKHRRFEIWKVNAQRWERSF